MSTYKLSFKKYPKEQLKQFREEKPIIKNGSALLIGRRFWNNSNVSLMLTDKHLILTKIPTIGLAFIGLLPWLIIYLIYHLRRKALVLPTAMMPIERTKFGLNKYVVAIVDMESGNSFKLVLAKKHFDTFVQHFSLGNEPVGNKK